MGYGSVRDHLERNFKECMGNPDYAVKRCLINKVMAQIAEMAPVHARGPYVNGVPLTPALTAVA